MSERTVGAQVRSGFEYGITLAFWISVFVQMIYGYMPETNAVMQFFCFFAWGASSVMLYLFWSVKRAYQKDPTLVGYEISKAYENSFKDDAPKTKAIALANIALSPFVLFGVGYIWTFAGVFLLNVSILTFIQLLEYLSKMHPYNSEIERLVEALKRVLKDIEDKKKKKKEDD